MNASSVALAATLRSVLALIWWSPVLFLRPWSALTGETLSSLKERWASGSLFGVLGSVVVAFVLEGARSRLHVETAVDGAVLGSLMWAGFTVMPMTSSVIYERKSWRLLAVNAGFQLAALVAMGAVCGARG